MNLEATIRQIEAVKIYYARPCYQMGTNRELVDVSTINKKLGVSTVPRIIAPRTRLGPKGAKTKDMKWFHHQVDKVKIVVGSPRYGKYVTTGVFSEMQHGLHEGKKVYLVYKGKLRRVKRMEVLKNPDNKGSFAEAIFYKKKAKKK